MKVQVNNKEVEITPDSTLTQLDSPTANFRYKALLSP